MVSSPTESPLQDSPARGGDEVAVPLGWQRKLVPRKGKGNTPKKSDVVYVAPDGEEIKSKTQLQRYLKIHPGGPAVSEFNWSSGETPRRSARFTSKLATGGIEAVATPKHAKDSSEEICKETDEDQVSSPPPSKRGRNGVGEISSDAINAGGELVEVVKENVSGKDETMEDANEDTLLSSGGAADVSVGDVGFPGSSDIVSVGQEDGVTVESEEKVEAVVMKEVQIDGMKVDGNIHDCSENISAITGNPNKVSDSKYLDQKLEPLGVDAGDVEPLEALPPHSVSVMPGNKDSPLVHESRDVSDVSDVKEIVELQGHAELEKEIDDNVTVDGFSVEGKDKVAEQGSAL
eukprot:c35821_g1_i1 orf=251-1291(+)